MKMTIRFILILALAVCAGTQLNAQKSKKKQDSTYLQNKQRADEQRNRDEELRRRNDSIRLANHRDSLANIHRQDSIRYDRAHRDSLINAEKMRRQDSIDKSQPPKKGSKNKKTPPKQSAIGNLQCAIAMRSTLRTAYSTGITG